MEYNLSYEPEADVIVIWVSKEGKITDAEMVGDVVIHWDEKGKPVMIEFLRASQLVPKMVETLVKRNVLVSA